MMGTYSYAGACLLIALGVYFFNSYPWKGKYKLPPVVQGGLPILGNLLQLPPVGHKAGAVVKTWAEQYGEMYSPFSIQPVFRKADCLNHLGWFNQSNLRDGWINQSGDGRSQD